MSARPTILAADEAARRVQDGAGLVASGNNFRLAPETMLAALERRFLEAGSPRGLTLLYPMMVEAARGTAGIPGTGFNRLAHDGLLRRVVGGSFSRVPAHELNTAIRDGRLEAYNLPVGTILELLRAAGRGERGLLTTIGLDTYIDPRRDGGRLNERTTDTLAEVVEFSGQDYLYYPVPRIDVAIVKGSLADERGNVSLEHEAFSLGALQMAIAARNGGGEVIVEVDDVVAAGTLDPRRVVIPGHLVSGIVRATTSAAPAASDQVAATHGAEWSFSGRYRVPLGAAAIEIEPKTVIARRALRAVPDGAVTNLGAGLPMYIVPLVARADGARDGDVRFSIEQGAFGGWPEAGGVAANPDAVLDMADVFDYYDGGGIDVSILSFAQVDKDGSVNVSRFGKMMPGCGGFVDITQNARCLVFCGTFSAGGEVVVEDGRVVVRREGRISKFVTSLDQMTFNARSCRNRAESVTYVTERVVFVRGSDGLVVTEVAPGIDLRSQVLDQMPFPVAVSPQIVVMDESLFA